MRNHQQAEKKEQQRIKDIVLNLDFRDEAETTDGEDPLSYALHPNRNRLQGVASDGCHRNAFIRRYKGNHSAITSNPPSGGARSKSSANPTPVLPC
jgi:hypothetical protein